MKCLNLFLIFLLIFGLSSCNPEDKDSEDEFPKPPPEEEESQPPRNTGYTTGGATGTYDDDYEDDYEDDYGNYDGGTSGRTQSSTHGGTHGGTRGGTSGGPQGGTSTGGGNGCTSTMNAFVKDLFSTWTRKDCLQIDLSRGSFSEGQFEASITSTKLGLCNCQFEIYGGEDQGRLQISSCIHEDLDTDCTLYNGTLNFETKDNGLIIDCKNSNAACGTFY